MSTFLHGSTNANDIQIWVSGGEGWVNWMFGFWSAGNPYTQKYYDYSKARESPDQPPPKKKQP